MAKLDHVAIEVSDLDAAIQFYEQKIGLKFLFKKKWTKPTAKPSLTSRWRGRGLSCSSRCAWPSGSPPMSNRNVRTWRLRRMTSSPPGRDLREKQVTVLKGPLEIPGMVRWLYAADPDGNVLEFVQWLQLEKPVNPT